MTDTKIQSSPAEYLPGQLCRSFELVIAGVAAAILLVAIAWSIYPGGYDWMNRDLSTLGRIFTVNGNGPHARFSVYNFALLMWGTAGAVFFITRSMLLESRIKTLLWRCGGVLFGTGLCGIGVVPADAPNAFWHVTGSTLAILSLLVGMSSLNRNEEPGKRFWLTSAIGLFSVDIASRLKLLPHCAVHLQKIAVIYIFAYLAIQSWRLRYDLLHGRRTVNTATLPSARKFAGMALLVAVTINLLLTLSAAVAFPGGFAWNRHCISILGKLFLTDEITRNAVYPDFMIFNGALAIAGCAIVVFWSVRAMSCLKPAAGIFMLFCGFLMGSGLIAVGMAPTNTLGLQRLGINTFALSVFLLQAFLLFRSANARGPVIWRWLIWGTTSASAIVVVWLGHGNGKAGQKLLILEVFLWLIFLGIGEYLCGGKTASVAAEKRRSRLRRVMGRTWRLILILILFLLFCKIIVNLYIVSRPSLAERLGFSGEAILLIVNADDSGLNEESNLAALNGMQGGLITSTTVMVPAPGFDDFVSRSGRLDLDTGIHLTHTNEWKSWNWMPLLSHGEVPGLYDERGFMHKNVFQVFTNASSREVYREAKAQIEHAKKANLPLNHLDSHMGVMQYFPNFMLAYILLAKQYDLPLRMPSRRFMSRICLSIFNDIVFFLDLVSPDELVMPNYSRHANVKEYYIQFIADLKPGVTEVYIHPALVSDRMKSITATWNIRNQEYHVFFDDPDIRAALKARGVVLIGYRHLFALQRKLPIPPPYEY